MRGPFGWVLAALVAGAAAVVAPGGGRAQAAATNVTVGDAAEAWYATGLSSCSSPVGCPPVAPPSGQPYPAGTLHVGETFGQPNAVAYLQPDLSSLPPGTAAVAGTMTLPLATMAGNGNANTSSAAIEACLAGGPIPDGVEGSTATPPPSDCSVHTAVKTGAQRFSLDLTPFLAAWRRGSPTYGIALVPSPAETLAYWQVTFNGRRLAGVPHITSELTLASGSPASGPDASSAPTSPGPGPSPPAQASPSPREPASSSPASPGGLFLATSPASVALASPLPALGTPAAPRALAPASGPTAPVARPAAGGRGFQYPEVMLLPLGFLAGLVFVLRVLTRDATPARAGGRRRDRASLSWRRTA